MTERTLTPGPHTALADDIRDHGYAIIQTRIERVPTHLRAPRCTDVSGCHQSPAATPTHAPSGAFEHNVELFSPG